MLCMLGVFCQYQMVLPSGLHVPSVARRLPGCASCTGRRRLCWDKAHPPRLAPLCADKAGRTIGMPPMLPTLGASNLTQMVWAELHW